MRAIRRISLGQSEIQEISLPTLKDGYMLVRVHAVALNPADHLYLDFPPVFEADSTFGCDYSGTVVMPATSGVRRSFKVGDRVAGLTNGGISPDSGCFADYVLVKADLQWKVPDWMNWEEAACYGVGVLTCAMTLYNDLALPWPDKPVTGKEEHLFIYGGSTATGLLAIQFAKLSGLTVTTVCSPRNFEAVKSFGADSVFDYHEPGCAEKIRETTNDSIHHVLDCIGASEFCSNAMSSGPNGLYSAIVPLFSPFPRTDVRTSFVRASTAFGYPMKFGDTVQDSPPEDFEVAYKFWILAESLLAEKKFDCHMKSERED